LERIHQKQYPKKIEEQKIRAASTKIDEVRARTKPVSTEELVSWIREDREP
jgi:hypothetical protein